MRIFLLFIIFEMVFLVVLGISETRSIAEYEQTPPSSGKGNTHPITCLKEPYLICMITSNQRKYDDIVLLTLIIINSGNSNLANGVHFAKLLVILNLPFDLEQLASIQGQYSNLVRVVVLL